MTEPAELYAAARRKALAGQGRRRPADPQTRLSAPVPPVPRRTLCTCGDFGPCRCAPRSLARAFPEPVRYEYERALAFYRRHPPGELEGDDVRLQPRRRRAVVPR